MLANTLYQLELKKQLRIAYFGGSITEGGGEDGWRRLTTKWFQAQWKNASITEINATIGGTGTDLGAYRCEKDVIAYSPDLTFIEFAVNDSATAPEQLARTTEAIVRKLRFSNPYMDIVFAFTITKNLHDKLKQGIPFYSRDIHAAIAAHYGLDTVDMGTPLAAAVEEAEGDWLKFTKDTVHPHKVGYSVMTPVMLSALSKLLDGACPDSPAAHVMPEPLYDRLPMSARFLDALPYVSGYAQPDTQREYSWTGLYMNLCNRYPTVIGANKVGAELTVPFEITLDNSPLGVYWMMASDSGDVDYRIDDGEWMHFSCYDEYCARFARANFHFIAHNLSAGSHTLTMRVSEQKHPDSDGRWIRIAAFGVC
ncbi:MAG: SGNH/GDSL hydrolase family protein [Clostridia bacterium]|nr:SGNH/GDSL hydrolase family protein [Clostridia bacterium]